MGGFWGWRWRRRGAGENDSGEDGDDRTVDGSRCLRAAVNTEDAAGERTAAVWRARVVKKLCDKSASHVRLACTSTCMYVQPGSVRGEGWRREWRSAASLRTRSALQSLH